MSCTALQSCIFLFPVFTFYFEVIDTSVSIIVQYTYIYTTYIYVHIRYLHILTHLPVGTTIVQYAQGPEGQLLIPAGSTYQLSTIGGPSVLMATGGGGVGEEASRKRELRLLKNRQVEFTNSYTGRQPCGSCRVILENPESSHLVYTSHSADSRVLAVSNNWSHRTGPRMQFLEAPSCSTSSISYFQLTYIVYLSVCQLRVIKIPDFTVVRVLVENQSVASSPI